MNLIYFWVLIRLLKNVEWVYGSTGSNREIDQWFENMNEQLHLVNHYAATVAWNLSINPNENLADLSVQLFEKKSRLQNVLCNESDNENFRNQLNATQLRMQMLFCRGPKFTAEQTRKLAQVLGKMQQIYTETKVCLPSKLRLCHENLRAIWEKTTVLLANGQAYHLNLDHQPSKNKNFIISQHSLSDAARHHLTCYDGEQDLQRILTGDFSKLHQIHNDMNSIDKEQIFRWSWEAWRKAVGPAIKSVYTDAIDIMNQGATSNGYHDIGVVWREEVGITDLPSLIRQLLAGIRPLYDLLHAVVRDVLRKQYPNLQNFGPRDPIPAHLLGNMWSQNWEALLEFVVPNSTIKLKQRFAQTQWTPVEMAKKADDFYSSMGLPQMKRQFWLNSNFEKKDNLTKCHGTAADMYSKNDYRMIVCAETTIDDYYVITHEMGHIHYYNAYQNQPAVFKDGTNSALQESVGDAIFLATMTPQHWHRLRLITDDELYIKLENYQANDEPKLNDLDLEMLLRMGLSKIPQIPFEYILDEFRWNMFNQNVRMDNANDFYWMLSQKEQGIRPAVADWLDEPLLFDAGAKYHVADNTPFIRYFLSSFLQAQIFKALCEISVLDRTNSKRTLPMPLYRCDIYGSQRAGKLLRKAMALGGSRSLSDILYQLTGKREISSDELLEYYQPLQNWLRTYVREHKIPIGWPTQE